MTSIWDEFRGMQDQMDRMFSSRYLEGPDARKPVTDVRETDDEIIAELEMPGADKEDIDVHVTPHGVEVSVQKDAEIEDNDDGSYRYERRSHRFYRHIPLPDYADSANVEATHRNGVLTLRIPKTDTEKKRIDVK